MFLLTGASGFLGKKINKILGQDKIINLSRYGSQICCDLSKEVPEILNSNIEIVIHAAGKAHSVPKNPKQHQEFFDVNVRGTENLLKALEQSPSFPKSFVFISSVAVYGVEYGVDIDEEQPLNAKDAYGLSKIKAEQIISNWCKKNNVICSILRLPLLIGTDSRGNLDAMIKGIRRGYYFNIGGGKARKSMVMAEDIARIIPVVAQIGGIYNLTDGQHPTFNELSHKIAKMLGRGKVLNMPKKFAEFLAKIGDLLPKFPINSSKLNKITSDLTFNDSKARNTIGWAPRRVLDTNWL